MCVPRSRPWAQFWTKSWSAPLTDVSCSPGACPQTCGTAPRQRRLLTETHSKTNHVRFLYSATQTIKNACAVCIWARVLTDALVAGVQQLSEWCGRSFSLNCFCGFLVLCQLTQHTCCHTLDVLHWRIQQLETTNSREKDQTAEKEQKLKMHAVEKYPGGGEKRNCSC